MTLKNKNLFKNELNSLTYTEKIIINWLINNPDKFVKASIHNIAKECYASSSAVVRLYRKLGFKSLNDMRFYVYGERHDLNKTKIQSEEAKLSENIFEYYNEAILKTYNNLDLNNLKKIVDLILNAKQINLYGLGTSYDSALELSRNLHKLGINSFCSHDFHSTLLSISFHLINQLIILFSKKGTTKEILYLIKICQKYNIKYILITNNKVAYNEHENVVLYETIEQQNRINSITSKISQHFIIDVILLILKNKCLDQNIYKRNNQILKNWNEDH